jgi:hypothetical protein
MMPAFNKVDLTFYFLYNIIFELIIKRLGQKKKLFDDFRILSACIIRRDEYYHLFIGDFRI